MSHTAFNSTKYMTHAILSAILTTVLLTWHRFAEAQEGSGRDVGLCQPTANEEMAVEHGDSLPHLVAQWTCPVGSVQFGRALALALDDHSLSRFDNGKRPDKSPAESIYKWKDNDGVMQLTSNPPPPTCISTDCKKIFATKKQNEDRDRQLKEEAERVFAIKKQNQDRERQLREEAERKQGIDAAEQKYQELPASIRYANPNTTEPCRSLVSEMRRLENDPGWKSPAIQRLWNVIAKSAMNCHW